MAKATENTPTARAATIPPFSVEVNHPRNCDVILQSLTGVCTRRLRTRITPTIKDIKGRPRTPVLKQQSLPELPGMQLEVHPVKCAVRIVDPMRDNEEYRSQLSRYLRNTGMGTDTPNGVPTVEATMDEDRMKTLCREVLGCLEAGEMEIVRGSIYTYKDVDKLPGDYLLNPGSLVPNGQPRYEKDLPEFQRKLNSMSG